MNPVIQLRYVSNAPDRTFRYKTLAGARARAHNLVGSNPKRDPDGYAVNRRTGDCLFFQNVTFEVLFPKSGVNS